MGRHASRFNKRDANEFPILKALARLGVEWIEAGPLDGWAILAGRFIPCEIKTANGKLTQGQTEFIAACERNSLPYGLWRSVDDAVKFVKSWRAKT